MIQLDTKVSETRLEIHKYETYMTARMCQVVTVLIAPQSPEARPKIGMIGSHPDSMETHVKAWTVRSRLGDEACVADLEMSA